MRPNNKYPKHCLNVLLDAREFVDGKLTGIARVIRGLMDAISQSSSANELTLAVNANHSVPFRLYNKPNIKFEILPGSFLKSEKALSKLSTTGFNLFISPYPKLPLFGCHCPSFHIIHDVLDLTHLAYKKRFKAYFDGYRLRKALKRADLTWYDSHWSMEETRKYAGFVGKNPQVRYPAIDERFNIAEPSNSSEALNRYGLEPGYILVIGNGLPHKNIGVLLRIADQIDRKIVFVGVNQERQLYWKAKFPEADAIWTKFINDDDLPVIIRGAFCLAQPSTAEGYGYPPLEAMACGIPAVVSNIPVLIETTGGNALIADPEDPQTWLGVFNTLEDNNYYKSQVENGLRWAEPLRGRKGWQKHVSDIEGLIRGD
jgi:glycosyltransferase involved in cell wall biosynthesis